MSFAEGTTVPPEKSRAEIETIVRKHGAIKIGSYTDGEKAVVTFATADRTVKFTVPMPDPNDEALRKKALWPATWGSPIASRLKQVIDSEERRRWRCLLLVIKAKFEGLDAGVETFDEAFLAHIVTPGGATIIEEIRAIEESGGRRLLGPTQ